MSLMFGCWINMDIDVLIECSIEKQEAPSNIIYPPPPSDPPSRHRQ